MNDRTDDQAALPPLPDLDDRFIKRAIFRGTLRTVFNVLLALSALFFITRLLTAGIMELLGRSDQLTNAVVRGLQVAHPEYDMPGHGCCSGSLMTISADLELYLRSPSRNGSALILAPSMSVFGHVPSQSVQVPGSALGDLVQRARVDPSSNREILERLPSGTNASAVILFDHPLEANDLQAVLDRLRLTQSFPALLFDLPNAVGNRTYRIGWRLDAGPDGEGLITAAATIESFRGWADSLSSNDDGALGVIDLPSADVIQQTARLGAIGLVVGSLPVPRLLELLDDPDIGGAFPAEVAFDVGIPQ